MSTVIYQQYQARLIRMYFIAYVFLTYLFSIEYLVICFLLCDTYAFFTELSVLSTIRGLHIDVCRSFF